MGLCRAIVSRRPSCTSFLPSARQTCFSDRLLSLALHIQLRGVVESKQICDDSDAWAIDSTYMHIHM